jgi:DNA-binding NarL/FixJ family response regulator
LYTLGELKSPSWLAVDSLLRQFSSTRNKACQGYIAFVAEGVGVNLWDQLQHQVYLGSEGFVSELQKLFGEKGEDLSEVPRKQKRPAIRSLDYFLENCTSRDEGIVKAFRSGCFTMKKIADYCGLHYSTVSKIISRFKT